MRRVKARPVRTESRDARLRQVLAGVLADAPGSGFLGQPRSGGGLGRHLAVLTSPPSAPSPITHRPYTSPPPDPTVTRTQ